jgi:hypothetical protein
MPAHEPAEVICLNDVAPYNMVHDGEQLVGFIDMDMASPGPRAWDLAYLAYRICGWCEDMPAPTDGPPPEARLNHLLDSYGRDSAPPVPDLMRTMRRRLHDLADWTDKHALASGAHRLLEHAAMYRRDAARLSYESTKSRDRDLKLRGRRIEKSGPHVDCRRAAQIAQTRLPTLRNLGSVTLGAQSRLHPSWSAPRRPEDSRDPRRAAVDARHAATAATTPPDALNRRRSALSRSCCAHRSVRSG